MEATWKPFVAGILNIVVGTINLFAMFIVIVLVVGVSGGALAVLRIAELMPIWLSGVLQGALVIGAILAAVFSALPLLGGIYAAQRKNWGLALAGSIVAILAVAPFGIVSTILVASSKKEFD
jgi:hypothetical protein